MHIITFIESLEIFIIFVLATFQYKNKIQKKNIKYKKRNIFLNEQLTSADNNYLRNSFLL